MGTKAEQVYFPPKQSWPRNAATQTRDPAEILNGPGTVQLVAPVGILQERNLSPATRATPAKSPTGTGSDSETRRLRTISSAGMTAANRPWWSHSDTGTKVAPLGAPSRHSPFRKSRSG